MTSYLQDAYIAVGARPDARTYAVLIALNNISDNDNGIASAALYLTYVRKDGVEFTFKVGPEPNAPLAFRDRTAKRLELPLRIDAHQTISGWSFFAVDNAVLAGASVRATRFAFTDTHGNQTVVEPMNVREYGNASETPSIEKDIPADQPGGSGSDSR